MADLSVKALYLGKVQAARDAHEERMKLARKKLADMKAEASRIEQNALRVFETQRTESEKDEDKAIKEAVTWLREQDTKAFRRTG